MGQLVLQEQASPSAGITDKVILYAKAGGGLYKMADDDTEYAIGLSIAGGVTDTYIPYSNSGIFDDSPLTTDGTDITSSGNLTLPNAGTITFIDGATYSIAHTNDTSLAITAGGNLSATFEADGDVVLSQDLYIGDDKKIYFGAGSDGSIEYDEDGDDELKVTGKTDFEDGVYESGGVLKENLLTNSEFGVWSNSTLEDYGSDLITNGTFDAGINDWDDNSTGDGSFAWDTDHAELDANTGTAEMGQTIATLTTGHLYRLEFDIAENCTSLLVTGGTDAYGNTQHFTKTYTSTGNDNQIVFEAAGTSIYLEFKNSTNEIVSLDNISLKEVTPGCLAADALACDGWEKTSTLDIYREPNGATYTKDGAYYSLKATKGADGAEYLWWNNQGHDSAWFYEKFLGRTVTIGFWVYSDTATDNVKPAIYHNGSWSVASTHAGADAWEWMELTATINASSTDVRFGILFDGDTSDVAYISQPMLVFGSSIGEGNYTRPSGEIINLETEITSATLDNSTGFSDTSKTLINIEADTNGKLPKTIKAIYGVSLGRDSGSDAVTDADSFLSPSSTALKYDLYCSPAGKQNGTWESNSGRIRCTSTGDIYYQIRATGSGTFDAILRINAVELR